jgi:hypothetical protein
MFHTNEERFVIRDVQERERERKEKERENDKGSRRSKKPSPTDECPSRFSMESGRERRKCVKLIKR